MICKFVGLLVCCCMVVVIVQIVHTTSLIFMNLAQMFTSNF